MSKISFMSSNEYAAKYDKIVFAIFIRTIRDALGYTDMFRMTTKDKIIKCCLSSRRSHISESYFYNMTYWAGDAQVSCSTLMTPLFLARIVNSGIIHCYECGVAGRFINSLVEYTSFIPTKTNDAFDTELYNAYQTILKNITSDEMFCEDRRKITEYFLSKKDAIDDKKVEFMIGNLC